MDREQFTPPPGSRNRTVRVLALLLLTGLGLWFAGRAQAQPGRVYLNLFEYRMCDAFDPNWCPNGDDFQTVKFAAMFANPSLGDQTPYLWLDQGNLQPHYRDRPGRPYTRYNVDLCESGDPDINGKCPEANNFDVIACTDGTRPVFYYDPGEGADANKWLIKIQGGGYSCSGTCDVGILSGDRDDLSSAYNTNATTEGAQGILSPNPDNLFKDYNLVTLDKCVGDRNQGDVTLLDDFTGSDVLPEGTGPVYHHGYRIILAILKQLKENDGMEFNDFTSAEEILFLTQSNGSNGAYHYIDRLSTHITQTLGLTASVRLLASSYMLSSPEVEYFFETGSWPASYADIPTTISVVYPPPIVVPPPPCDGSPGCITAPNTSPLAACGPGFDRASPFLSHWLLEGRTIEGRRLCDRLDYWEALGGADGRGYATQEFISGVQATFFNLTGADNGVTVTWDESCVAAHPLNPWACRDSMHVMTHHLSTPVFFAAQAADRNIRTTDRFLTMWAPYGNVWAPADMQPRVEKLAEVITGYQPRSGDADSDLGNHGFFIDNTVDHMGPSEMSKLTRQMKANRGPGEGVNFQLQEYLKHWLDPNADATVQCLDSNPLYDVEFAPPFITPINPIISFPVNDWPASVRCEAGYYTGGTQPYQVCDDPGFGDPANPALNRADPRFVCESPPRSMLTVCAGGSCDYADIQTAVAALAEGGRLILAAETFTGSLTLTKSLTIQGAGPEATILQAAGAPGVASTRVITVAEGARVTLEGLAVRYGNAAGAGEAGLGGGILNQGTLTLNHTAVYSSSAALAGGGVYNGHTTGVELTIVDSAVFDNSAPDGGGIYNGGIGAPANLTVRGSALLRNTAANNGGGLFNDGTALSASAEVENSTFTANTAQAGGGAGNLGVSATLTLTHATFSFNTAVAGGGLGNLDGAAALAATILANSPGGGDCASNNAVGDGGFNLVEDGTCGFAAGGDPLLGPLQDNGGPVWTHALLPGSPALDAVPAGSCPAAVDQRGALRPQNGACDIGAFELGTCPAPTAPTLSISGAGSHVLLGWNGSPENREIEVWRGSDPFDPGSFNRIGTMLEAATTHLDLGAAGDPTANYFYAVRGQNACGETSANSNVVGEFDVRLGEVDATNIFTGTGALRFLHFAVVAIPLEGGGLPDSADALAAYLDPGGSVRGVAKWNSLTSSWIVRRVGSPFGTPDFAVSPGDVVLVGMTPFSPEIITWYGEVPLAGTIQNNLVPNAINPIIIPLDQNGAFPMTADGLAAAIGGVTHVAGWNPLEQRWVLRTVGVSGSNFPVFPGYPYVIRTDGTAPPVWP